MFPRLVKSRLDAALEDTPAVLLIGPRRSGKTTLVREYEEPSRRYLTLDDHAVLSLATTDPVGFIRGLDSAVIDEVQRAPDLLLAIKKSLDDDYRPGRFLLTGSANVMTLPRVADSLAGRMETLRLLPLSRAEVAGHRPTLISQLFRRSVAKPASTVVGDDLVELVLTGGFPESIARRSASRRRAWALSYLDSVLTRDLRDIAEIEKLAELPRFVRLLGEFSSKLVNFTEFGASIDVSYKTAQRYVSLLQQIFLVDVLPAWHANTVRRLVKSPKLHFGDTGLLSAVTGIELEGLRRDRTALGPLVETFVYAEIRRLSTGLEDPLACFHFRDAKKNEVDLVLERRDRSTVGIEVKASATVTAADFRGLRVLAESVGERFSFGAVLYDGEEVVPFGEDLAAVPLSCLWQ